jgi:tRNA1(Val) A37 N6-methylase TrmN6
MKRTEKRPDPAAHSTAPAAVRDVLFGGRLSLWQPKRGYRVNIDTLLLAEFAASARVKRPPTVVDLGAGVGAATLVLNYLSPVRRVELVERQPNLALLAGDNLVAAHLAGRFHAADLSRDGLPRELTGAADLVISNPPFFKPGATRPRTNPQDAAARAGPVEPFLKAAAIALGRRGAACFVYPAGSLVSLCAAALRYGLMAKRMRLVHAFPEAPARVVLLELRHAKPGGLVVESPLVEWSARGVRSEAVAHLIESRAGGRK